MPCVPRAARPAPRGTLGFEKIFVCCSASQKDRNFKFSPVGLGCLGASMCKCSSWSGRGKGGWKCWRAAHQPARPHGHPSLYQEQAQRAGTHGQDLRIWQGKGEELPSHPTSWPWVALVLSRTPSPAGLLGAAAKDRKGNPNPGRKHRAATLLSCSRDPQWHSSSDKHHLMPSKWRSCQQAPPGSGSPGGYTACSGEAVPTSRDPSNKSLCLAGVEAPRASSPWQEVLLAAQLTNALPKHGQPSEW